MSSNDASMNGEWYSILMSHATVSAKFDQTGSSVTGWISWALAGIGTCTYQVTGSVSGTAFTLTGTTATPEPQICPQHAKLTGTVGVQVIDVDGSPWGSFALRPDGEAARSSRGSRAAGAPARVAPGSER
jgi:hypothetical protein